jgi:hypothetical protein
VPGAPAPVQSTRTDFEIVDEVSDISPRPRSLEPPEAGHQESATDWNEARPAQAEDDELLSMLSEEDATVGLLPKEFAARFGARLEEKREEALREIGPFDDNEATVGSPEGTQIASIRSVADSGPPDWDDDPPTYYDEPPRTPLPPERGGDELRGSGEHRPVPRAPSLDLKEESVDRTRRVPSREDSDGRTPAPAASTTDPAAAPAGSAPPGNGAAVTSSPEASTRPAPARPAPAEALSDGSSAVGSLPAASPVGVRLSVVTLALLTTLLLGLGFAAGYLFATV